MLIFFFEINFLETVSKYCIRSFNQKNSLPSPNKTDLHLQSLKQQVCFLYRVFTLVVKFERMQQYNLFLECWWDLGLFYKCLEFQYFQSCTYQRTKAYKNIGKSLNPHSEINADFQEMISNPDGILRLWTVGVYLSDFWKFLNRFYDAISSNSIFFQQNHWWTRPGDFLHTHLLNQDISCFSYCIKYSISNTTL